MKKMMFFLLAAVAALTVLRVGSVSAADVMPEKKLTLMVYMCGSNLESGYGAASADIEEMKAAGIDPKQVTVLLMTGGAQQWSEGYSASKCMIHQIGPRGTRVVWQSDVMNMGEAETLTRLLTFGRQNYPAENYALVLWNHGGGPIEGVCWDELFSLDRLTLQELTSAILRADIGKKLSWIGFDACLMGSVEVASALSPCADFMIASQETEPSRGWDYRFLKGIENDADGAATGRRIVDGYFDSLGDTNEILTMACTDLSRIGRVTELMDAFFSPLVSRLDAEVFSRLSALRMASVSFGAAVRGAGDGGMGYDLVDLFDLISKYGGSAQLTEALRDAVVYSRAGENGVNGLSVYHPYANKQKYLEAWREDYQKLDFCSGYTRYLNVFGALLTGEKLADWHGLSAAAAEKGEDGVLRFSLRLTPEQRAQFSAAQLLILESTESAGLTDAAFSPISAEEARIDDNGLLTAEYRGRSLYVVDEDNNIMSGPVSFLLADDGKTYVVLLQYEDYSGRAGGKATAFVQHFCELDEETGDMRIMRTRVFDPATQSYTNRIEFSEEGFTTLYFHDILRDMPRDADPLPAFYDWGISRNILADGFSLPRHWHFRMFDDKSIPFLYASFQITDLQQNTYSSPPARALDPKETAVVPFPDTFDTGEGMGRVSMTLRKTDVNAGFYLDLSMDNTTGTDMVYGMKQMILNGHRMVPLIGSRTVPAGESKSIQLTARDRDLTGIEEIRQVELMMEIYEKDNYRSDGNRYFSVVMDIRDCDTSGLGVEVPEALAETDSMGVHWELLSVSRDPSGDFHGLLYAYNGTDETLDQIAKVSIDHVLGNYGFRTGLAPHTDRYIPFSMDGGITLGYSDIRVSGSDSEYYARMDCLTDTDRESGGIEQVDLFVGPDSASGAAGEPVSFRLREPIRLAGDVAPSLPLSGLLEGDISVALEGVFVGDDGAALALRMRNDTDVPAVLTALDPRLNGSIPLQIRFPDSCTFVLPAHTTVVSFLSLKASDPQALPDAPEQAELRFILNSGNTSSSAVIRFPAGTVFGTPRGLYCPADTLEVTPAFFRERTALISDNIVILDPEEARPVHLIAPLTPEESLAAEYVHVYLCLISPERAEEDDGTQTDHYAARCIVFAEMTLERNGRFTAMLSGLAVKANGHVLCMDESYSGNSKWVLQSSGLGGMLFFFSDAARFNPSPYGLYIGSGSSIQSSLRFNVHVGPEGAKLTDSRVNSTHDLSFDFGRDIFFLDEAEALYSEEFVFLGVDGNPPTRVDPVSLPLESSVALEMVPVERLEGRLGLYYVIRYSDDTRGDRIVDWETGEILESMGKPGHIPPPSWEYLDNMVDYIY